MERIPYAEFSKILSDANLPMVQIIPANNANEAIEFLQNMKEFNEGIVMRIEGKNGFEHISKYVQPEYKMMENFINK